MINALIAGDIETFLISLLLSLPIVFLALSVHETAHGYAAYRLGDPTAKNLGRLTLNPAKHIDPIGFLCMLLFGFGWAKPVPIDTRYFKKPKRDMALTGLAGPLSNVLLALVFAILLRVALQFGYGMVNTQLAFSIFQWTLIFLEMGVRMNVTLAVFNLIPVPPLDGSRIFLVLLPSETYFKIMRYERYIYIALMVALAFGLLDGPIDFVSDLVLRLIYNIAF